MTAAGIHADTAAEHAFAAVATSARPETRPPGPPHPHPAPTSPHPVPAERAATDAAATDRATTDPATGPSPQAAAARPRVRLVPALPPARPRPASTPLGGPPPTLAERVRVLRADDRPFALGELDDLDEVDDGRDAAPAADASLVVRRLAGAGVEVIAGRRPAGQLARWLAPGVLDALRTRAALTRRTATPPPTRAPTVRGVRVCALHERLVEASAVVDDGRRVRAIALRLEPHRGAWRATAFEIG